MFVTGHLYSLDWNWDFKVVLVCAAIIWIYLVVQRFRTTQAAIWFTLGMAVLIVALLSPLDVLGGHYLFSAHMVQHLLLIQLIPPLLLVGIPPKLWKRIMRQPLVQKIESVLGWPVLTWLLGVGTLWLWHVPELYDAAVFNQSVHELEHLAFLVTSTMFWWPIIAPAPYRRMQTVASVIYLFGAAIFSSVLGILLSFAPVGIYAAYINTSIDPFGVWNMIRYQWGITAAFDQQLGGLIMWILGGVGYLCGAIGVFARWYSTAERANYEYEDETVPVAQPVEAEEARPAPGVV